MWARRSTPPCWKARSRGPSTWGWAARCPRNWSSRGGGGAPNRLESPANFLQILQRVWWRLDRALDGETVRASALVGGMDALLSGTTVLIDHHASPSAVDGSLDLIADALAEGGVRSVLCYEVTDRDGPERAHAGVRENERFLQTQRPLSRGLVGAHASFTLSPGTLAACVGVPPEVRSGAR